MSEFRGEALHMCPRIILKCQKVKKLKTTIKLSKLIKMNDYTPKHLSLALVEAH